VSSLTKVSVFTIKIAIACLSSLLIACEPLLFGGVAGLAGSSSSGFQCASGPADLSGVCRNTSSLSPGALEAVGTEVASAATLNTFASAQQLSTESTPNTLNIAWSPYPGSATGYYVYYGPTSDSANTLASDLPIDGLSLNASAPTVSYQPTSDLNLGAGDTVCFRILAYDSSRVPYTWSEVQCTVV
jgi:hypothetical protein